MNSNKLEKHFITKKKIAMISETKEPHQLFTKWLSDAKTEEINNYNAMNIATVGRDGRPSNRMVLLKDHDKESFVFYTNYESKKGESILENPFVSLCFHWKSLKRQVRIEGKAEQVSPQEADAYYASRARESQIAAWASEQSRPMKSRGTFEQRLKHYTEKFPEDMPVPRPAHWSGFRIVADRLEFWQEMPYRQHDRVVYTQDETKRWVTQRLYP